MMKRRVIFLILLAALAATAWLWKAQARQPKVARARLQASTAAGVNGFARAYEPRPFEFPRDHGPHPEFQTEWWYYTGNLETAGGQAFGFQLTFFRRGLTPGIVQRASSWGTNQVYLAHFALTDVTQGHFAATERFSRGAAGLAGAQADPYRVWLENWGVEAIDAERVHLHASDGDRALDLTLTPEKPPVAHGDQGLSPKSATPGNASYYYSLPRLATQGSISRGDERLQVQGSAWMDHEYSTSALAPDQVGWDWFSLQLDDGWDLMYFQLRRADGSIEPVSSGSLVAPDGSVTPVQRDDITLEVLNTWNSPHSGARYPARWRVRLPSAGLDVIVEPLLADQELNVSFVYWEGAVRITGTHADTPLTGRGYVELTGYAHTMQGEF
jgi:predicted secreted hydrolase